MASDEHASTNTPPEPERVCSPRLVRAEQPNPAKTWAVRVAVAVGASLCGVGAYEPRLIVIFAGLAVLALTGSVVFFFEQRWRRAASQFGLEAFLVKQSTRTLIPWLQKEELRFRCPACSGFCEVPRVDWHYRCGELEFVRGVTQANRILLRPRSEWVYIRPLADLGGSERAVAHERQASSAAADGVSS